MMWVSAVSFHYPVFNHPIGQYVAGLAREAAWSTVRLKDRLRSACDDIAVVCEGWLCKCEPTWPSALRPVLSVL